MTAIQEIRNLNQINQEEIDNISKILLDSFVIKGVYKSNSLLAKKELLLNAFSDLIEKYIELDFAKSKETKLQLINFMDKLNMQKEFLELSKGETKISDIKLAAQRLGRKSQSAFKSRMK